MIGGVVARHGDAREVGVGRSEFRLLELALDFESPQVAEDGPRLCGQSIGFHLQGLDAGGGPISLHARILRVRDPDQQDDKRRRTRDPCHSLTCLTRVTRASILTA